MYYLSKFLTKSIYILNWKTPSKTYFLFLLILYLDVFHIHNLNSLNAINSETIKSPLPHFRDMENSNRPISPWYRWKKAATSEGTLLIPEAEVPVLVPDLVLGLTSRDSTLYRLSTILLSDLSTVSSDELSLFLFTALFRHFISAFNYKQHYITDFLIEFWSTYTFQRIEGIK